MIIFNSLSSHSQGCWLCTLGHDLGPVSVHDHVLSGDGAWACGRLFPRGRAGHVGIPLFFDCPLSVDFTEFL